MPDLSFARITLLVTLAGLVPDATSVAYAQTSPSPNNSNITGGTVVIPYEGVILLDDVPLTGIYRMTFTLWNHVSSTSSGNLAYEETQDVTFYNGRFSVGIGAGTQQRSTRILESVIRDGDRLYVSVSIRDQQGSDIALSGRQAVEPLPFSMWAAQAANFEVGDRLTAAYATITGELSVSGSSRFDGAVTMARTLWVSETAQADQVRALSRLECSGDAQVGGALTVSGDAAFASVTASGSGSFDDVSVSDELTAARAAISGELDANTLDIAGSADIDGTLDVGRLRFRDGNPTGALSRPPPARSS